ncbi:MAG TPA: hypothetical protein VI318_21430, partial [Baekduia sp.]
RLGRVQDRGAHDRPAAPRGADARAGEGVAAGGGEGGAGRDGDGDVVQLVGRGTIVSRRQPDGRWLIVLDRPESPC